MVSYIELKNLELEARKDFYGAIDKEEQKYLDFIHKSFIELDNLELFNELKSRIYEDNSRIQVIYTGDSNIFVRRKFAESLKSDDYNLVRLGDGFDLDTNLYHLLFIDKNTLHNPTSTMSFSIIGKHLLKDCLEHCKKYVLVIDQPHTRECWGTIFKSLYDEIERVKSSRIKEDFPFFKIIFLIDNSFNQFWNGVDQGSSLVGRIECMPNASMFEPYLLDYRVRNR